MNRNMFLAAGLCLAGLIGTAAQPASAAVVDLLTVTLPHAANVGGVILPAGKYTVRDLQDNGGSAVFQFYSNSGHSATVLVTQILVPTHQAAEKTQVIIVGEKDKYDVDKIWLNGLEHGYQLQSSSYR